LLVRCRSPAWRVRECKEDNWFPPYLRARRRQLPPSSMTHPSTCLRPCPLIGPPPMKSWRLRRPSSGNSPILCRLKAEFQYWTSNRTERHPRLAPNPFQKCHRCKCHKMPHRRRMIAHPRNRQYPRIELTDLGCRRNHSGFAIRTTRWLPERKTRAN
jgi:hypothetical protein